MRAIFYLVITFILYSPLLHSQEEIQEPATENPAPSLEERQRSFTVARQLLNEGSFEQASLILEELIETDDEIGNFAMILLYRTKAGAGEEGLIDQIENQGKVEIKPQLLLAIAEGYFEHAGRDPERDAFVKRGNAALDALLRQNLSNEMRTKASLLKTSYLMQVENYDLAMRILLDILDADSIEKPYDQAWFYLGKILERSIKYRDIFQARLAYQKILSVGDSTYRTAAIERIDFLNSHHFVKY